MFDAEKVGETLMDIRPGLPETDDFQHWPPWRPLVVETEIGAGLARYAVPVRHFVLHADQDTLRGRIEGEHPVPSLFRLRHLEPYAEAAHTWLHAEAEVIDTSHRTPAEAALQIAEAVTAGPCQ